MRRVDLSANPRIAELTGVLRLASTVSKPEELQRCFGPWVAHRFQRDFLLSVSRRDMEPGRYKITRVIPGALDSDDFKRYIANPGNPWRDWESIASHEGGLLGDIIADDDPKIYADIDLTADPVLAGVMGEYAPRLRHAAAFPTFTEGESLNWAVSFSEREGWLGLEEFENGLLDLNMMGSATKNLVMLGRVRALAEEQERQFMQIAQIQRALLPERLPDIPGLSIATSYLTSEQSGGDYYDFFPMGDGRWGVLIADVSGHGAPAATVMAMLHAILHCRPDATQTAAAVLEYANHKLLLRSVEGSFVTAFFGVFDPRDGSLAYARAGHNPPILKRADRVVQSLDGAGAPPLGVFEPLGIEEERVQLNPGDTLILYTDGITEAFGPNRIMYGTDGLLRAMEACSGEPDCAVDTIHRTLFEHTGRRTRDDDQTLVALRYTGMDAPATNASGSSGSAHA